MLKEEKFAESQLGYQIEVKCHPPSIMQSLTN